LIDIINPTFIGLTATAIYHWLSIWKPGEFRDPLEFVQEVEYNISAIQEILLK
jgi:hypothetical protein